MAEIDVSELMSDPDFVDKVEIITRVQSVDGYGEASMFEEAIETVGCVQPASYRTVMKLPEAQRVENLCSFWVRHSLAPTGKNNYPSVIVFRGKRFQVKTVAEWSNFGSGFSEGTCVAERIA